MTTTTAIPAALEMESMFPEVPETPAGTRPAPAARGWQRTADRISPPLRGNHWCIDQGGKWFQFKDGSYPVGRWVQIDGTWYCFGMNGYLRCGWIEDSGKWYYTDSNGAMLVNTRTPDGCYVGGDGAWIH